MCMLNATHYYEAEKRAWVFPSSVYKSVYCMFKPYYNSMNTLAHSSMYNGTTAQLQRLGLPEILDVWKLPWKTNDILTRILDLYTVTWVIVCYGFRRKSIRDKEKSKNSISTKRYILYSPSIVDTKVLFGLCYIPIVNFKIFLIFLEITYTIEISTR